ncbi:unnamed protein product, partial [Symbiodinium microadriaticum]
MPRSHQADSSSATDSYDSDDLLSSASNEDDDMGPLDGPGQVASAGDEDGSGAMVGPTYAELPPVQLPAAYPDYPAFMERNATMALRELCFFFLAEHLRCNHPNRRVSTAKYNAQRRSRGNQDPGDLYAYVYVQLEEGPAARLDAAYTALAGLWNRGVPENDITWLASVGSFQDPPRHVCLQHLDRMLRSSLRRHLDTSSADHMADFMVDHIRGLDLFYIPTLLALFPLLDDDGRREFQQWFLAYSSRQLDTERSSSRTNYAPPADYDVAFCALAADEQGPLEYTTTRFTALHSGASRPEGGLLLLLLNYGVFGQLSSVADSNRALLYETLYVDGKSLVLYRNIKESSDDIANSSGANGDGPPFQISWAQLHSALASLPRNKALPPGVAPSRLWGIAADPLTDKYLPALNGWLADMSVPPPEEWHVADLCLIPKPSKPLTGPEALRPISLIHPISKALSIILNNRIKPQLWHLVADLPQMAYLESRSVQDALDRASAHCARVRAVLRAQRQNIHLRKQGHRQAECKGGVLLSIDLRQAFDVMPRPRLKEAMDLAQVDPAAQHVILQLHAHACLRIKHGNQTASLDTANGVRQGCCLAPSLWVLYTGLILTYIRKHVDMADATVFADDFLFHWMVDGAAQLEQVLKHIAFVLETLESFGMSISPGKSAVLIGLRGSKAGTALRKHVIREPRKGKQLHCRTSNGLVRLPVVPSHPYLGAILSYQSMEALTLKERMRQSWSSFHRILPALRSNSVALRHRVLVWQSCVQSTLMHGLDSVGSARRVNSASHCPIDPDTTPAHAAPVLKWLEGRTTSILSPCQFCATDFKVFSSGCVMESHMKDALHQEIQDVANQEILAAADQANLLSAMMRRSEGALGKPAPSDPGQGSTGPSTPSAPPREAEAATTAGPEPVPMEERSDRHWRSDSDRPRDQDRDKAILNLCMSMGRLLLRHEDQFGINRSQDNYVMFAQCQGMLSMVPELYVAAEAWKTMKKETPALLTLPLRAWLLKHWVDLMLKRVEMIMTSEETVQQAKDMLILDEQCNIPYLEWNRTTRALQVKRDRDPMTLTQVLELLKTMQHLVIQPMTVMRFHATRELCQEMKSEVVP